jgi:hypothetical protein
MPKTLMQSVISELQKERKRLEDELHRVAAALTAFGNVYMRGSQPKAAVATRKKRTISAAGRKELRLLNGRGGQRSRGKRLFQSVPARDAQCYRLPARGLSQPRKRAGQSGAHKSRARLPIN